MELNEKNFISELTRVFGLNGLSSYLDKERCEKFYRLTVRMLEENEKYNLTAIKEPEQIILNHYADCVMMAKKLTRGASVIDIGCGAGFPTLPLAIVRDDLRILAVDSTAKRINYVKESAELLGLSNVSVRVMRAEEGGRDGELRERFDYATARAVAQMRILCELCLPFVRVGGELVAMKGKSAEYELKDARRAIATLGGGEVKIESVVLTDGASEELTHPLISVKKKQKTPSAYPRAFAQISKKPL
ncbi:MAG: 16S rRNA (guanine(527)-N(7))-methyltransferase RsmG [Clostridia bacterium]|nr:16S rRNA (guanine(527)-N(7))-methyltransferase RsmG [Clostridia bacterium]